MIIRSDNGSFELDKVQGFYIETDFDYNPSTEKYDRKGYVVWAAMPRCDIKVTSLLTEEEAQQKLQDLTEFWAIYLKDIISYE